MKNLILTKDETKELEKEGSVEIIRNGFDIVIEKNNNDWESLPYLITIINPYESVKLTKDKTNKINYPNGVFKAEIKTKFGNTYIEYVEYIGRQEGFECSVCGKGCNAYTFNILHGDTLDEALKNYVAGDYETIGFGREHLDHIKEV